MDLAVDDICVPDFEFGDTTPPVARSVGVTPVSIYLTDGPDCGGTLVATTEANLSAFETALAVAHLDQNGAIRLSAFSVPTAAVPSGRASVSILHLAAAPKVDVLLRARRSKAFVSNIATGEQAFAKSLRAANTRCA